MYIRHISLTNLKHRCEEFLASLRPLRNYANLHRQYPSPPRSDIKQKYPCYRVTSLNLRTDLAEVTARCFDAFGNCTTSLRSICGRLSQASWLGEHYNIVIFIYLLTCLLKLNNHPNVHPTVKGQLQCSVINIIDLILILALVLFKYFSQFLCVTQYPPH